MIDDAFSSNFLEQAIGTYPTQILAVGDILRYSAITNLAGVHKSVGNKKLAPDVITIKIFVLESFNHEIWR